MKIPGRANLEYFRLVISPHQCPSCSGPMSCVSVVTLPGQVRLGHDEARLSMLHAWISALCDPGSGLVTELNTSVRPVRETMTGDKKKQNILTCSQRK